MQEQITSRDEGLNSRFRDGIIICNCPHREIIVMITPSNCIRHEVIRKNKLETLRMDNQDQVLGIKYERPLQHRHLLQLPFKWTSSTFTKRL